MSEQIKILNDIENRLLDAYQDDGHTDEARVMFGELAAIFGQVRNGATLRQANGLEVVIREAAPPGARPTVSVKMPSEMVHPSNQPPDRPRLSLVDDPEDT